MKAKNYLIALAIRAALFLGFYSWSRGVEGAGNVLQFTLWTLSIALILGAFAKVMKAEPMTVVHPKWWVYFSRVTYVAILVLLIWFGCPVLAAFFLLAWFFTYAAHDLTKPETSAS